MHETRLDATDRRILNAAQGGFPIAARPYRTLARRLGLPEADLIARVKAMLDRGVLSRFGPLYRIESAGGETVLCAARVPQPMLGAVSALLAEMPAVAHNYEREHEFNLWFVLSAETPAEIRDVVALIESRTGLTVYTFEKQREYFLDLRFTV